MSTVARPLAASVRSAGSPRARGASRAVALSGKPRSAKLRASRLVRTSAARSWSAPQTRRTRPRLRRPRPRRPPPADPESEKIAAATAEIKAYLKLLYVKREMNFNEVRLTLAIEDPRLADRRERYGIEDESGVSADEKVAQLEMIDAGETPRTCSRWRYSSRISASGPAWRRMRASWPARRAAGPSRYAEIANSAAGIRGTVPGQRPGALAARTRSRRTSPRRWTGTRSGSWCCTGLGGAHLHHHRRALHHVRQLVAVTRRAFSEKGFRDARKDETEDVPRVRAMQYRDATYHT